MRLEKIRRADRVKEKAAEQDPMYMLCENIRTMVKKQDLENSRVMICRAMADYPDAPQPHNLMGILLEKKGEHEAAMKHFRAAWALNQGYLPARMNLELFGGFAQKGEPAYQESDCIQESKPNRFKVEFDVDGIGHVVRKDFRELFA